MLLIVSETVRGSHALNEVAREMSLSSRFFSDTPMLAKLLEGPWRRIVLIAEADLSADVVGLSFDSGDGRLSPQRVVPQEAADAVTVATTLVGVSNDDADNVPSGSFFTDGLVTIVNSSPLDVDDDVVSLSNLQRQVAHLTPNVGMSKTQSAHQTISGINPNVEVVEHTVRLSEENAAEIISGYDIVADGCDNFVTRFLVSDACFHAKIPLVSAAIGQFDGQISTFKPYETAEDGTPFPTYRCLHGEAPAPGTVPTCAEAGRVLKTANPTSRLEA